MKKFLVLCQIPVAECSVTALAELHHQKKICPTLFLSKLFTSKKKAKIKENHQIQGTCHPYRTAEKIICRAHHYMSQWISKTKIKSKRQEKKLRIIPVWRPDTNGRWSGFCFFTCNILSDISINTTPLIKSGLFQ